MISPRVLNIPQCAEHLPVTKEFDQVMFNSLVLTWERNFEVTFGIFSVLVSQINVLESYLDIYLF